MRPSQALEGLSPYDPKFIRADVLLSANENPCDIPAAVRKAVMEHIGATPFNRYPDPAATELRKALSENLASMTLPTLASKPRLAGIDASSVVVGNGGDELLYNLFVAFGGAGNKVLSVVPSFSVYDIDAKMTGTEMVHVARRPDFTVDEDAVVERVSRGDINLVFITSPNNPTGDCISSGFVERLLSATDALIVMDEAYAEFSGRTSIPLVANHPNICVLRTFSKAYALAGVRLGYVVGPREVVDALLAVRQPYSVDAVAQAIGLEVCRHHEEFARGIVDIVRRRDILLERLSCISGLEVFPSEANFLMVRLRGAEDVWRAMVDDGVLVRNLCGQEFLEGCLRITVGTDAENEAMIESLAANMMKGY